MSKRIAITGIGIVSSIGNNAEETFNALIRRKSGIGKVTILETLHKDDFVLGEIKLTHDQLILRAGVHPEKAWTRTALLGIIAARQALNDAFSEGEDLSGTAVVSATTVGGMDRTELYFKDFLDQARHKKYIDCHHAGNSTEMIAEQLGLSAYLTTISTACSSSLNSIIHGAKLLHSGRVDRVIAGGTDALSKYTVNGFNTLMILDPEHCRPFDASRRGLNLGEGAAYLVLEPEEKARLAGKNIYALLSGYANANDAYHQTASSSDGKGPYLAMKGALEKAGLEPAQIDYINVHGTGTDNNDLTEGIAMKRLFGESVPDFSSTKAYTGHTLGAAGSVEAVFSILAMNSNTVFPNINFKNSIEEIDLVPATQVFKKNIEHVLTNSFGFGGNDTSVVFSKAGSQDSAPHLSASASNTSVFINGMGSVSPQNTLDAASFLENPKPATEKYMEILQPDFREYIAPAKLRRMSKIVRMGIVAAKTALAEAQLEQPDAILTGTGMGCLADTEKFLDALLDQKETLLNPSPFIQSTHNTMGAQIALMLGNNNYNMTYVHRTFSFETALLDCMMLIRENEAKTILLGGIDEVTAESWLIKTKIGFFKKEPVRSGQFFDDRQQGALAGEGSAFFVLSPDRTTETYASVLGSKTFFRPEHPTVIARNITEFLDRHGMKVEDLGLVLLGFNGDSVFDDIYSRLENGLFGDTNTAAFKHLCGEFDTAAAFAMWIAARVLKSGKIPVSIRRNEKNSFDGKPVLIYNHFRNVNHSLILLGSA